MDAVPTGDNGRFRSSCRTPPPPPPPPRQHGSGGSGSGSSSCERGAAQNVIETEWVRPTSRLMFNDLYVLKEARQTFHLHIFNIP